jgi:hypothetical protein
MKRTDCEMLATPYAIEDGESDDWFRRRLGIDCPEVSQLAEAILADLDPKLFGVGWWVGQLDTKRRILIGDCLYQAVESIEGNLTEAKLHLLELADWYDVEDRQNEDSVYVDKATRRPRPRVLPPQTALEQVPALMSTLHVVGTLQALNSALDCLAGAIVGVCALPLDIQEASYGKARAFLRGKASKKPSAPQTLFGESLEKHVIEAGPAGWLAWMQAFRNANLHRGRRLHAKILTPRAPQRLDSTGAPVLRADTLSLLPTDPGFSEIEALLCVHVTNMQLSEPAMTTLNGCLSSTRKLIRAAATDLSSLWSRRRECIDLLSQPSAQWPDVNSPVTDGFEGYAPGSVDSHIQQMHVNPSYSHRLRAAAIDAENRHRWDDEFE